MIKIMKKKIRIMDVHETKEDKFYSFVEILLAFQKCNKKYMITHICTPAIYCPLIEYVSLPVY